TIAQNTDNEMGAAGIAFNVSLMPVKVLNADGQGYLSDIAEAIRWAADHEADVINMSLSASLGNRTLRNAVDYAYSKGVLIVASSGNSSGSLPQYPANYADVIAVGATTYNNQLAYYSNRGNELCAPGGTDREDLNGDGRMDMILQQTFDLNTREVCNFGYWFGAGTSMAAPHVSGLAALMLSVDSTLTNEDVKTILQDTADEVEPACGHGVINAYEALWTVANSDNPPSVKIKYPLEGEFVSGKIRVKIDATDHNDAAGALTVEWNVDGGAWKPTTYNSVPGLYESEEWDTSEVIDGQHFINARATDSAGNKTVVSNSVLMNNVNDPPVVSFTYTCSGLMCDFDASGSYDPDGTIQNYDWSFGDGTQSEPGSGATVSHTYAEAGTYTVSITVIDDGDASNFYSEDIPVNEGPPTMHIGDLDASSRRMFGRFWEAKITFTLHDSWHEPVADAWVYGLFSDGSSLFQCSTNANGKCSVYGYQYWLKCLTFTVTDIWHDSLVYDPAQNQDPDGDSDGTNITVCRP
ncbi:MAG: S8 family serine peptidase, partial [Deltaproteobacteria bacterium]